MRKTEYTSYTIPSNMIPDLEHFGTVVGLNNSFLVQSRIAPAMPHTAGQRRCYNTHYIPVRCNNFLESHSVDPCKPPGSDLDIRLRMKLLDNRTTPGYLVGCWMSNSLLRSLRLRPQFGSFRQQQEPLRKKGHWNLWKAFD